MAQTVTPKLLGRGVVDSYQGKANKIIFNASVVYAECGKCGYVNILHYHTFHKRRAQVPTTQGKLVVHGFYCTRCKSVNATKGLNVRDLPQYTHIDQPVVQSTTEGTIDTAVVTTDREVLTAYNTLIEIQRGFTEGTIANVQRTIELLESIDRKLGELLAVWK